jgi:glycosyltransferase involved in cell wall biosynthesis
MNPENPIISVITVTYNNLSTLKETIASVQRQSYPHVEHIVVDGNSTDGTAEYLRSLGDSLRFISGPDEGLYDAMNKGIAMATGDFVGFLNADDFFEHDEVLAEYARDIFHYPNTWAFYSDLVYVDALKTSRVYRYWKSGPYRRFSFLLGWMPPHPTVYVRRAAFDIFGGFRNHIFRSAADYEFILRLLYVNRVPARYLPGVKVRMRVGGVSNRSWANRARANWEDRQAWIINRVKPLPVTHILKPFRKVIQFIRKPPERR